ncbi:alkaline phosphatase family protein [Aeoliella mucimassa]|uniref:alkaline phosphatase family protein n=1 Tax=Aeoliella mucimassa TaxID=2527972 RepID=UPI0018D2DB29|nr:alkaline phosphatase family protein [Aeoliella mucimassa]
MCAGLFLHCAPCDAADYNVDHVIHITVDGLRGSAIDLLGPTELPNFYRIQSEGAYTNNARTLRENTVTMPNHISILTGRPRDGELGHGVTRNSDPGDASVTVHTDKGEYVPSVFDVVHDHGGSTAFYAGWSGFNYIDNSWNEVSGAADLIGADNGKDKIDVFNLRTNDDIQAQTSDLISDLATDPYTYTFMHMHRTDAAGHGNGWDSEEYRDAVRLADVQVGRILDFVSSDPTLSGNTAVIITADHGGIGTGHGDINSVETYRVPFYTWVSGEQIGQELYSANAGVRADPGLLAPDYTAPLQPIRNGDSGNLALDLLGLGAVPGSSINSQQNLRLKFELDELQEMFLMVDPVTGATQLRNQSTSDVKFDGYAIRSASGSLNPERWHSLDDQDGEGPWRESNPSSTFLAELYQDGDFTMTPGQVIDLEELFDPSVGVMDLEFELLLSGQSTPVAAQVFYNIVPQPVSSIDEVLLLVNPNSGDVQLRNQSGSDVSFEAYKLQSESGSLLPEAWQSLDDLDGSGNDDGGWRESNPSKDQLAELLESGDFTLESNHVIRLGNIFDSEGGMQDLAFQLLIEGEANAASLRVVYDILPENPDYNGDGIVNLADYTIWRDTLGAVGIGQPADGNGDGKVDRADYEVWKQSFGQLYPPVDNIQGQTVPEPPAYWLLALLMVVSWVQQKTIKR